MKKILISILCLMPIIAMAEEYGTYDDEDTVEYTAPDYECPVCDCGGGANETYVGLRVYKNEHSEFRYAFPNGHHDNYKNDNFGFGTTFGNRLTNYARVEYETLYMGSDYSKDGTDYEYDLWANFLNGYLFYNFDDAVAPYIGLGLGLTGIWGEVGGELDSSFDLSYQAMVGIMFELNNRIGIDVGFKYANFGRVEHTNAVTKVDTTQVYIGASYKFGI